MALEEAAADDELEATVDDSVGDVELEAGSDELDAGSDELADEAAAELFALSEGVGVGVSVGVLAGVSLEAGVVGSGEEVGSVFPRSVEVAGTKEVVPGGWNGLSRAEPSPVRPWSRVSPSPPVEKEISKCE